MEGLNFANPVTVEKTIQKITKTFEKGEQCRNIEYAKKKTKRNKIKDKVKATSNKNIDANVSAAAKEFLRNLTL